ncbi:unnamed protein product [Moneuplotes crassus]|uniref:Uncharacterized protein n=1 Tax=Euplotes crassus TaxID=5936 RepID=A0AAD2D8R3_EUPCR|nr:unnamed protein product [Moneuplotes crassus]
MSKKDSRGKPSTVKTEETSSKEEVKVKKEVSAPIIVTPSTVKTALLRLQLERLKLKLARKKKITDRKKHQITPMTVDEMKKTSRKVSFNQIFCYGVLPYYDYIDKCYLLMSCFTKSLRKFWKKFEGAMLSSDNLFSRRLLIITDSYLEAVDYDNIDQELSFRNPIGGREFGQRFTQRDVNEEEDKEDYIPYKGCKFSYYNIELVAVNYKCNYNLFMKRLFSILENGQVFSHQYRYIKITRCVGYRLTEVQEKLLLKHFYQTCKMKDIDIMDNYETKDKIDYYQNEVSCTFFRKPLFTEGERASMDESEQRDKVGFCGNYFPHFTIDFRLCEENEENVKELTVKKNLAIRCLSIKGYDRLEDDHNKELQKLSLKCNMLKIWPLVPKLSMSECLSSLYSSGVKYLCIGYEFKNEAISAKETEIQGKFFQKLLMQFSQLKYLVVWGFPVTTVLTALNLHRKVLDCLKIVTGPYRNYYFDDKIGEIHCHPGKYEYRTKSNVFNIQARDSVKVYREGPCTFSEKTTINNDHFVELLFVNTIFFKGSVRVNRYPGSRMNSMTKKPFQKPCFIIPKQNLQKVFIEHTKALVKEIHFLASVCNKREKVSGDCNSPTKFEVMRNYMHKIQWHDLTISYMANKEDEYVYIMSFLKKQKKLSYLTLWISNIDYLVILRRCLRKIIISDSFKIYIVQGDGIKAWFDQWKVENPRYYKFLTWRCRIFVLSGNRETYEKKIEVRTLCETG